MAMRVGVIFPQTELGGDRGAVRAYAEAVTELGYDHIALYDHVVGADPAVHSGWSGPYDVSTTFHEPFVLFGFMAALTPLELVTSIVILPQRQTVLVAKQAAEIDLLTDGHFRLGVGIGWNAVEYEALRQPFTDRGGRLSEQIELLRALWSQRSVTFDGTYERVTGAGLAPRPIQRPIPVWIGARAEPALRRAGRLADGWFPMVSPGPALDAAVAAVRAGAAEAGRDSARIGMEGRITFAGDAELSGRQAAAWRAAGATHLSINTMGAGNTTVDLHIAALSAAAEAVAKSGA
jgi:probable F420-dependent oxidoreductase